MPDENREVLQALLEFLGKICQHSSVNQVSNIPNCMTLINFVVKLGKKANIFNFYFFLTNIFQKSQSMIYYITLAGFDYLFLVHHFDFSALFNKTFRKQNC